MTGPALVRDEVSLLALAALAGLYVMRDVQTTALAPVRWFGSAATAAARASSRLAFAVRRTPGPPGSRSIVAKPAADSARTARVFVFIVRREVHVDGAALAQALCDQVFGAGRVRAVLWKIAGPDTPSIARALALSTSLGVGWDAPAHTWQGRGPDGVRTAALFWDA